jgi:hypothetical protein
MQPQLIVKYATPYASLVLTPQLSAPNVDLEACFTSTIMYARTVAHQATSPTRQTTCVLSAPTTVIHVRTQLAPVHNATHHQGLPTSFSLNASALVLQVYQSLLAILDAILVIHHATHAQTLSLIAPVASRI